LSLSVYSCLSYSKRNMAAKKTLIKESKKAKVMLKNIEDLVILNFILKIYILFHELIVYILVLLNFHLVYV